MRFYSLKNSDQYISQQIFIPFLTIFFILSFCIAPYATPLALAKDTHYPGLPEPGTKLDTSQQYEPALIKGLTVYPENPLQFNFIVYHGEDQITDEDLRDEGLRMIKYFMASVTIPKNEMWVNLSPYERDKIISPNLGITEMGKDLLMQDYLLKQLSSSLLYPEDALGRKFWNKLYKKIQKDYQLSEVPLDMFNKIWIVPQDAVVFEKDNTAFVINRHLKVMLEEDYLAAKAARSGQRPVVSDQKKPNPSNNSFGLNKSTTPTTDHRLPSTEIMREIILPAVEKEVNQGKTFSRLRQIYNAMILAMWYKQTLREGLIGKVYADQGKVVGIDLEDKTNKERIYNQYLTAFKKGVYDYIREEYDPLTKTVLPRRYFSGGLVAPEKITIKNDFAQATEAEKRTLRELLKDSDEHTGLFVKILELENQDIDAYVQQRFEDDSDRKLLSTTNVLNELHKLLAQEQVNTLNDIRRVLDPFKNIFFYDTVYGYDQESLIIERGKELWVIVASDKKDKEKLLQHIQQKDTEIPTETNDILGTIKIPGQKWQIVRINKGLLTQSKLIDLQLIENNGFKTVDLKETTEQLPEDQRGNGLDKARQRIIDRLDYEAYLDIFLSRLKGKTILDETGKKISLFINNQIQTTQDLLFAAEKAQDILKSFTDADSLKKIYEALSPIGLERGWGNSLEEIQSRLTLLINSSQITDKNQQVETLLTLDEMTPTVFSAVFISTHGWFVLENAFGKPDTGGQVSFVRDEAKSTAQEISEKMEKSGIPGKAVVLIFTRLIPEAEDTKANQEEEIVFEDAKQTVRIVRVPFSETEKKGFSLRGLPRLKNTLELVQSFIRRFEIWSYITDPEFVKNSAETISKITSRYGIARPDLILGNYSDGNFLAAKLSDYYGGDIPVTMTAHALELSKYFKDMKENGLIDNWFETEDGRYLAAQALIDAWVMRKADIIETSTLLEILGQYSFYEKFEFEKLFKLTNGITLNDAKFMINEPSIDHRTEQNPKGLFFAYEGPEDKNREEFAEVNDQLKIKIFGKPDPNLKIFDRFGDWKNKEKPIIFTMARFDSKKNITGLIEEFGKANLKERANLVIVGGNPDYVMENGNLVFKARDGNDEMNKEELTIAYKIIDLVDKYDLKGHIRWTTFRSPPEAAELYRVMHDHVAGAIFAQPAILEAFGLTILEAMATKLLVVATDQGGPKEIIRHKQDGFLANPETPGEFGSMLKQALDTLKDQDAKDRIISSALKRIETKYSWKRRVRQTLQAVKYFTTLKQNEQTQNPDQWEAKEEMLTTVHNDIVGLVGKMIWDHKMDFIEPEYQPELEALVAKSVDESLSIDDTALATRPTPQLENKAQYGGIDFNSDLLHLQIKRDGNGIPLPVSDQPLESIHIQGFTPIIIDMTPVNLPLLLGMNYRNEPNSSPGKLASDQISWK